MKKIILTSFVAFIALFFMLSSIKVSAQCPSFGGVCPPSPGCGPIVSTRTVTVTLLSSVKNPNMACPVSPDPLNPCIDNCN